MFKKTLQILSQNFKSQDEFSGYVLNLSARSSRMWKLLLRC